MNASFTDSKQLVVQSDTPHEWMRVADLYAALASMPNGAIVTGITYDQAWKKATFTFRTAEGDVPT